MSEQDLINRLIDLEEESRELLRVQLLIRTVINAQGERLDNMEYRWETGFSPTEPSSRAPADAGFDVSNEPLRGPQPGASLYAKPGMYGIEHSAASPEVQKAAAELITGRALGHGEPEEAEAAFVTQVEIGLENETEYVVKLRFDDDGVEELSRHGFRVSARDYAETQCRRYHVPLFDSSWEKTLD